MPSHYEILGVQRNASAEEIRKAFRLLLRRHHPDSGGQGGKVLEDVIEAYRVLSDPARRKAYDSTSDRVAWAKPKGVIIDFGGGWEFF